MSRALRLRSAENPEPDVGREVERGKGQEQAEHRAEEVRHIESGEGREKYDKNHEERERPMGFVKSPATVTGEGLGKRKIGMNRHGRSIEQII